MSRVWAFLREKISLYSLICIFLIYLIMHFDLQGVELVIRGTSVVALRLMLFYGVIIGWLLGRTELKLWISALITFLSGFSIVLIHIGGIDSSIWDLITIGISYLFRLAFTDGVPDPAQVIFQLSVIWTRIQEIISSLPVWGYDLLSGFSVYNQISTLLTWGYILFLMSAWFSWITKRRDLPLWGVLPAGILLAILMTYTLEKRILLALLLGAGLILIGIVNHEAKQREWLRIGVRGAAHTRERAILTVITLAVYIMVFAGLTPSIRISFIADPFERLVYGESDELVDGEGEGSDGGSFGSDLYAIERFAGLPRQKLIGSGPELAKRVVMIVRYPTTSFVETEIPSAARYWRSYSYDWYTGTGWQSSDTEEIAYRPGQEITALESNLYDTVTQEIRLSNAIRGTLYSAGPPVTVDHEVLVSWRSVELNPENGNGSKFQTEDRFAATIDKMQYQVRSLVPKATEEDLRAVSDDIPTWIKNRYLVLPESVPDRVFDLAEEIITNQPTSYDRAKAIETFLRSYPYTLDLPAPPFDRDVADYFLFDLQTGYCDYYATSMVVLARAVGLPARVVVGYVGGQYEVETDQYLVTEADAHSWVEIYFSDVGWIPFEPTAARALIDDQELSLPLPPELEQLPISEETAVDSEFPWTGVIISVIILLVIGLLSWNRSDMARLERMDGNNLVLIIYNRLYLYSRWLGVGHLPSDTIFEFKQRMTTIFKGLAAVPAREARFSEGIEEINQLTHYAVQANYSQYPLDQGSKTRMLRIWKRLRIRMRNAIWISFWRSTARKINPFRDGPDMVDGNIGDGAADGKR